MSEKMVFNRCSLASVLELPLQQADQENEMVAFMGAIAVAVESY